MKNAHAEDLEIKHFSDFVNDEYYNVASYAVSQNNGMTEIIVVQGKEWNTSNNLDEPMMLVDKINESVNEDNELVYQISGYKKSNYITYLTENKNVVDLTEVEKGDLIRCTLNSDGDVKVIEVVYDVSSGESLNSTDIQGHSRVITAYIHDMDGDVMNIGYDSALDYDEKWNCTDVPVLIYDSTNRRVPVQLGTTDDLRNIAATAEYSKIVIQSLWGNAVQIIIYK